MTDHQSMALRADLYTFIRRFLKFPVSNVAVVILRPGAVGTVSIQRNPLLSNDAAHVGGFNNKAHFWRRSCVGRA